MIAYHSVRLLMSAATRVFFRDVSLSGLQHVPREGERPVLFAGNHPNSLVDPALLCTTAGRVVHFAAADHLFKFPLTPLLYAMGAVPIARRMDYADGKRPRDNGAALDRLYRVLSRGRAVGIFPEGLSHDESQLQKLRTGAARIALETAAKRPEAGVQVICCGLQYAHRRRFRSRVLVQYGPPIDIDEAWVARYAADSKQAAADLTAEIEAGLRALTVNAPDWETLRVLDGVRRLYQPKHISLQQRIELSRRFAEVYQSVKDQPAVVGLYRQVEAYLNRLDDVGLTDRDLVRGMRFFELVARASRNIATLCMWLPLAVLGSPVHAPILAMVSLSGRTFAPRPDAVGAAKLMLGIVAVLAAYIGLPTALAYATDWRWGAGLAVALPLTGFATLRVLERGASLRRIWRSAWASLRLGHELAVLRSWRDELEEQVLVAVQRLIPADMEPLFPDRARPV